MSLPILIEYATVDTTATPHIGAVVSALARVPGCEPVADALGNRQSVVRADAKPGGGFTITYPAAVNAATITSAISSAKTTAAASVTDGFNKNVAAAVLMDRLRNNLDDVKTARGAIQGGSMFSSLSVAEKAFLALVCDELDALARLKVTTYEIVD